MCIRDRFSKTKLALDNHVYKNCEIDDCDVYYSGGQYELIDTHITNSRLILNHPAKGIYSAIQIFKTVSYTHLDVYKRQRQGRQASWHPFDDDP